jgi:hypothetical protein
MRYSSKLSLMLSLFLAFGVAQADDPHVLVLRNGATLVGRVTQDGDSFVRRSLTGTGESRYPAAIVAKHCKSPREAYEYLRPTLRADEPLDHCRLARFCVTHELLDEAKTELALALKLDPRCTEARTLQVQMDLKKKRPAQSEPVVPALPSSPVMPIPAAKLDDWPLALTPAGFKDYSQRVQPMLLLGCGTGACHGVAEGKRGFLLTRGLYGLTPSPLVSHTNLERVLGLVDKNHLDESLLLAKAREKHGGLKTPPLDPQAYTALRQWVLSMAGKPEAVARTETPSVFVPATVPTSAANGFAAGETAVAPPAPGTSPAGLPPIPGLAGGAARQLGLPPPKPDERPATEVPPTATPSGPPKIPGLTGKAAEQMGQKPPAAPPMNPPPSGAPPAQGTAPPGETKPPAPQDTAAFQDFARRLGHVPPVANVTKEPPRQMRLPQGATYRHAFPPLPDIPDDIFYQLQRQAHQQKAPPPSDVAPQVPFLNGGTVVNSPAKPR